MLGLFENPFLSILLVVSLFLERGKEVNLFKGRVVVVGVLTVSLTIKGE